jgi:hypothetical protein
LPASISDLASGSEDAVASTPPATISCRPGAAPFEGTKVTFMGSIFWLTSNRPKPVCQDPPSGPPVEIRTVSPFFSASSRSARVLYLESAGTCTAAGSKL